ncbi:MAG: hypothetical protein AAFX99_25545 [Myxococcota bacterium]
MKRWEGYRAGVALVWALGLMVAGSPTAYSEEDLRFRVYVHEVGFYPDPGALVGRRPPNFPTEAFTEAAGDYFDGDQERFVRLESPRELFLGINRQALSDGAGSDGESRPTLVEMLFLLGIAEKRYEEGVDALAGGELVEAERHLKEAAAIYKRFMVPLLRPQLVARVYQYLGLVYAALPKRRQDGIGAFQRMLRLDPRQVLVTPYVPPKVARMHREAREKLLSGRRRGPDAGDREMLETLGMLVEADMVVWGYVVQRGDQFELTMQMYRVDKGVTLPPERVMLTGDQARDAELANRLVSRFAACIEPLPEPPTPPPDREEGRFYLDASFTYATYLNGPTDQGFDNYGVSVSASYMMTERCAWVGRATFLTSGSDFENDLLTEFSQVRLFAGAGFGVRFNRWVRPFLSLTVEATRLGRFSSTDEFFCKVNTSSPGCAPSEVVVGGDTWQAGVNVQLGGSLRLYEDFSIFAAPSLSFYVFPLTDKDLDLPVGADVGLQYRF